MGGGKPSDQQIIADVPIDKDIEEVLNIEIKGIDVKGNLAQAFVRVRVKYLKKGESPRVFGFLRYREKGEVSADDIKLYYIKTDRGWVKISNEEFVKQLKIYQK